MVKGSPKENFKKRESCQQSRQKRCVHDEIYSAAAPNISPTTVSVLPFHPPLAVSQSCIDAI